MTARRRHTGRAPFGRAMMLALAAWCAPTGRADVIVTSSQQIENCTVQTIRSGMVFYETAQKSIATIPVAEIASMSFEGLHELDDAERYLTRGEIDPAIDRLLVAITKVEDESKRTWLHARLALAHGRMGDTVEAAGHLAAVLEVDPSTAWLALAPKGAANEATFNAAGEAMNFIDRARRRATDGAVKAALEEMRANVAPVWERLQAEAGERRYRAGSTISGILLRDIGKPRPSRAGGEIGAPGGSSSESGGEMATPGAPRRDPRTFEPGSAEAIDALLEAERFDDAVRACEEAAKAPGDRDLAQFLHQRGAALLGAGRARDAAVEFMRCAVHFPGTRWAVLSLIETGIIYRDQLVRPETAKRLFDAAAAMADEINDADLASRAREAISQ